jgi:hypothetical protein
MTITRASGTLLGVIDQSPKHARSAALPVEILVSFSGPAGPIAGTTRAGADGVPSPFHGWLELMDALEASRAGDPDIGVAGDDA